MVYIKELLSPIVLSPGYAGMCGWNPGDKRSSHYYP